MRAARDQTERVRIDLIDVDRAVFVEDDATNGRGRSRQVLKGVGLVALIAVAAAVWWPFSEPPEWRVYQPAPVPAAGLTDELVFDRPPGQLLAADLAPRPVDVKPEVGYVFSEPGGTILTRRWASFRTRPANRSQTAASDSVVSVNGVPAEVRRLRLQRTVAWGPLDGRSWTVTTNRFDEDQAVEFANSVAVIDDRPALAHRYDLGAMQPVGSTAALDCVMLLTRLLRGERLVGPTLPTVVTWASPHGETSLGSIAAPSDALPLVEFVLNAGRPTTVHGLAAVEIKSWILGTVVAWLEDDRLIMVVGDRAEDGLITLAESVRPATSEEWHAVVDADATPVVAVAQDPITPDDSVIDLSGRFTLYEGIDPATGDPFAFTVEFVDDQVIICVEERADIGTEICNRRSEELPLLITDQSTGWRFVLAIVDRAEAESPELRIKIADGTWTLPLEDFGTAVPGVAVATLLPAEYGVIELWNGGEIVAAI